MTGSGGAYRFPIEEGKVQEFVSAVGARHPDHQGRDAVVPATFLMASAWWRPPEEFALRGMDLTRVLHASQEFTYIGEPPRAGTELTVDTRIERQWTSSSGELHFTTVLDEFRDGHRVVASARMTVVIREEAS